MTVLQLELTACNAYQVVQLRLPESYSSESEAFVHMVQHNMLRRECPEYFSLDNSNSGRLHNSDRTGLAFSGGGIRAAAQVKPAAQLHT